MCSDHQRCFSRRSTVLCTALLVGLFVALPAGAQKKIARKQQPAAKPQKRIGVDISKLVWPVPPAPTRVRYVDMFTGEKIDWDAFDKTKQKQKKQSWMDRLAGAKPIEEQVKIPFQLIRTYGVAGDSKGNIYAADQGVGAIFIYSPETKAVQMIKNGVDAQFGMINGLAIDDNDRLFVTDDKLNHVIIINPQHKQEGVFGDGLFVRPGGIAIDTENRLLYVVDAGNDVVNVFDADSLKRLRQIGKPSKKHNQNEPGTFSLPSSVAVDKEGNVYVTDTLNNRVQIFDADGNFISMFGKNGDAPGYLGRPKGIAVDCDGHIWVADAYQDRVQVFSGQGQLLLAIGDHGPLTGQFQDVFGIAIDKFNRVIVSEQFQGRVQVFKYVSDSEAAEASKLNAGTSAGPNATASSATKKGSASN